MCYDNDFDYYGESKSNTNVYSGESYLFRSYFECLANDFNEWNYGNVVARFE